MEDDCPQFIAEDHRKGKRMHPHRPGRHEKQDGSVMAREREQDWTQFE